VQGRCVKLTREELGLLAELRDLLRRRLHAGRKKRGAARPLFAKVGGFQSILTVNLKLSGRPRVSAQTFFAQASM